MYGQEKKKSPRNTALMLDLLHIVVGALVVICAVLAFINPEKNQFLFPVIFCLAAVLNGVNGWNRIKMGGRDKKKKAGGIVQLSVGAALLLVGILSAVSIWR